MSHLIRPMLAIVTLTLLVPFPSGAQQAKGKLPEGTKAQRDIEYVPGGSKAQTLDLFFPEKADAPLPLIVWIHGGGWSAGSKENCPAMFLLGQGYAVASINYRLSGEAKWPAQIEDCKAAIRWLRANAKKHNINPDRIGVWGSSAGGHLVAMLGTAGGVKEFDKGPNADVSSRVQAACDWFGPTDLLQMGAQSGPNSKINHDSPNSPESRLIGGAIQENKEKAATANPIKYVTKDGAPFLIMHGDQDPLVPLAQSQILHEALQKAGVESTFHVVKGAGHGFGGPENQKMVQAFFDKHLKK